MVPMAGVPTGGVMAVLAAPAVNVACDRGMRPAPRQAMRFRSGPLGQRQRRRDGLGFAAERLERVAVDVDTESRTAWNRDFAVDHLQLVRDELTTQRRFAQLVW